MSSHRNDRFLLLASGARTETATADAVVNMGGYAAMLFELDVTAAATAVGDTLNVFVQSKVGNDWVDVVHFTEVVGDGGAKRHFGKISAAEPTTMFENASALGAAAVRHFLGDEYRVRFAVVDADADNASFTFSVVATGVSL